MAKRAPGPGPTRTDEEDGFLRSLRHHDRVIEAETDDAPLPPGVTHVLVDRSGGRGPRLVERRKSFF